MAGCEDDATHCLYLTDHTGDCRGGHDAILTNHKVSNLKKRAETHGETATQRRIFSFGPEDRPNNHSRLFEDENVTL